VKRLDTDADSLGLSTDSPMVVSIRQCVMRLASDCGQLASVQSLAQSLLTTCWPILLPTTEERVTALSALLPLIACNAAFTIFIIFITIMIMMIVVVV